MAKLSEVTDDNFESEVEQSRIPVLVDFWAPWCGPCRMVGPVLEKIAEEREGTIKVVKVDIDQNIAIARKLDIRAIPTILLFNQGLIAGRITGAVPKSQIDREIDRGLASPPQNT